MSSAATTPTHDPGVRPSPGGAFASVLNAAVQSTAGSLEQTVGSWVDKLNDVAGGGDPPDELVSLADEGIDHMAEGGGTQAKAGAAGLKAKLEGRNPFRAAVAGAWRAGTPVVRAAIISAIV